jgi:uncharacterized SAM-binding protein YcdF (DUF218 family)
MDFWFSFKKMLSIYINPVSITLELIFIGVVFITFAARQPKKPPGPKWARLKAFVGDLGVFFVVLGMLTLYTSSIDPIANSLTLHLEAQNPPLEEKDGVLVVPTPPEFVVVLAGGHLSVPGKPTLSRLSRYGFARVVGGVDLWKHFPGARFVVTGHPGETEAMRAVAEELGVPADQIIEETESRDTKDHPRYLKPILGEKPFLLVTSAVHMPRSVGLFRNQGFEPIVAPVDFLIWPSPGEYDPYRPGLLLPRVFNLQLTSQALHEIGGMAWSQWRSEMEKKD